MTRKKKLEVLRDMNNLFLRLSWSAWRQLPRSLKVWVDAADLYQESRFHAYKVLDKWSPEKGAVSTFLHHAVRNKLTMIVRHLKAKKRFAAEAEWVSILAIDKGVKTIDPIIDAAILIMFGRSN